MNWNLDSADPPLAVHRLYADRHRQLRRHDARATSGLGDLLAAAPARLAPVHRSVPVRAAVRHQVAQRASITKLENEPWRPAKGRNTADWREETLARMRALILEADPEMTEERKWKKPSNAMAGVPVWSHNGIVCTGETYTKVVKLTFARGASIPDPSRLFNSSLEGNTRRAIDIHEGEKVDARAFKALVKAAVAQNGPPTKKR